MMIKSMKEVTFTTWELQPNNTYCQVEMQFKSTNESEIVIFRNGKLHSTLNGSYFILPTLCCGICSTDLARVFLPFPLPQITGHEVVVDVNELEYGLVEINDAHISHNDKLLETRGCKYCLSIPTQCPERITFGINQWPGGFAPYVIVPKNNLIRVPKKDFDIKSLVLVEPFAATVLAVENVAFKNQDTVAVLGAGRLGLLLLAALVTYRAKKNLNFHISTIVRSLTNAEMAKQLGADHVLTLVDFKLDGSVSFDVVFDTTGKAEGLETALKLAKREVHLKSTHGQPVLGIKHLTELVVDEIALVPYSREALEFGWISEEQKRSNNFIYIASPDQLSLDEYDDSKHLYCPANPDKWISENAQEFDKAPLPRFDLAIASNAEQVDFILRPNESHDRSLVRARGAILLSKKEEGTWDSPLLQTLVDKNIKLTSSRCGNFERALSFLSESIKGQTTADMVKKLVTHEFDLKDLPTAIKVASGELIADNQKKSIKIMVNCQ